MQYFIGKNGQQLGPFGEEQIRARVASGEFSPADLVWREGMAAWEPVSQVLVNPYQVPADLGVPPPTWQQQQQPLAGAGGRLVAVLLNGLFGVLAALPGGILAGVGSANSSELKPLAIGGFALMIVGLLGWQIYQLMLYLKTGQTLGKKLMGIKVVRFLDGGNPGFGGLVAMRELLPVVLQMEPVLGPLFYLVDCCFIFRADRRTLHDLMANTKVVVA